MHLLGLGIVGCFVLSGNEGRGNFAVRWGERRQSFGDLEAHFRALRCVCLCVPLSFLCSISWHMMHEFSQGKREEIEKKKYWKIAILKY